MKTYSKIYISLFTFAFIALAYFSYPIIKERYFSNDKIELSNPEDSNKENTARVNENPVTASSENQEDINDDKDEFIPKEQLTVFKKIEKEDCLIGCATFNNVEEKKYCLQVCDSLPQSGDAAENCIDKSGLEKDYCHKNIGIVNQNFDECKKIIDKNIRKSCVNIITDKILEKSESSVQNP